MLLYEIVWSRKRIGLRQVHARQWRNPFFIQNTYAPVVPYSKIGEEQSMEVGILVKGTSRPKRQVCRHKQASDSRWLVCLQPIIIYRESCHCVEKWPLREWSLWHSFSINKAAGPMSLHSTHWHLCRVVVRYPSCNKEDAMSLFSFPMGAMNYVIEPVFLL